MHRSVSPYSSHVSRAPVVLSPAVSAEDSDLHRTWVTNLAWFSTARKSTTQTDEARCSTGTIVIGSQEGNRSVGGSSRTVK